MNYLSYLLFFVLFIEEQKETLITKQLFSYFTRKKSLKISNLICFTTKNEKIIKKTLKTVNTCN